MLSELYSNEGTPPSNADGNNKIAIKLLLRFEVQIFVLALYHKL